MGSEYLVVGSNDAVAFGPPRFVLGEPRLAFDFECENSAATPYRCLILVSAAQVVHC